MEEGGAPVAARRGPLIAGVVAIVIGGVLIRVGGTDGPVRPQVLGEMIEATTTSAPAVTPAPTGSSVSAAPATTVPAPRPARRATVTAPPTTEAPSPSTTGSTPSPGSSTSSPPTTTGPCPAGEPAAQLRSWDGGTDESGVWHVTVSGIVSNRTGEAVDVDAVAIVFTRADGSTYEIVPELRPLPDPRTLADESEATWRFEGDVAPGEGLAAVDVALTTWRFTVEPAASCHR